MLSLRCHYGKMERLNIVSMFCLLETDIREQKKYEKRIQASVDNTVNDLGCKIKFENRVKDKNNFLLSETLLFFFKQKYFILGDISF